MQVFVKLFGLGKGDASRAHLTRSLEPGTTVRSLWESLCEKAPREEKLARIDPRALLAVVNGRPLRLPSEWEAELKDEDTVVYMPKAFGG